MRLRPSSTISHFNIAPTVGVGLAPLEGVWPVLDLLGAPLDLGGLCLAVRFGGGLAAGGALVAAA